MDMRASFLETIRQAPNDPTARMVYADWLADQDNLHELANFVRATVEFGPENRQRYLQLIAEHPHDDGLRLGFAEYLARSSLEADQKRSEFIKLQYERAALPERDVRRSELMSREQALLNSYGMQWLDGDLGENHGFTVNQEVIKRDYQPPTAELRNQSFVAYERGFIEAAYMRLPAVGACHCLSNSPVTKLNIGVITSRRDMTVLAQSDMLKRIERLNLALPMLPDDEAQYLNNGEVTRILARGNVGNIKELLLQSYYNSNPCFAPLFQKSSKFSQLRDLEFKGELWAVRRPEVELDLFLSRLTASPLVKKLERLVLPSPMEESTYDEIGLVKLAKKAEKLTQLEISDDRNSQSVPDDAIDILRKRAQASATADHPRTRQRQPGGGYRSATDDANERY